jgi:hypothetical protein
MDRLRRTQRPCAVTGHAAYKGDRVPVGTLKSTGAVRRGRCLIRLCPVDSR